jgi:hypothetical protein
MKTLLRTVVFAAAYGVAAVALLLPIALLSQLTIWVPVALVVAVLLFIGYTEAKEGE